ncbi:MAG: Xaa-Pro peptidase family protein [Treponema sp.]|jgi:Xaa-Pro dipeptidase|nr:Xaa-Pro peptidase family protein [Treponema sp.]
MSKKSATIHGQRRKKLYDWMAREGITLAMFEDTEGRRDLTLRWLTGHPSNALLFLSVDQKSLLVPWDVNLAGLYAEADFVIPYGEFGRNPLKALRGALRKLKTPALSRIEIPPVTSYPLFLDYVGTFTDYDIICRRGGIRKETEELRAVKDEREILLLRKGADITNGIIGLLERHVRGGKIKTEAGAARFIDAEARKRGCEGTGFETLAAGSERSFAIHAFPPYTDAPFGGDGFSILDFGLKYRGYTTDVTITFVRSPSPAQEKIAGLVEKAYQLALSTVKDGVRARALAAEVDGFFAKSRKAMPHALGHGIGLEEHEAPALHSRDDNEWVLRNGMIITLEPGLYDQVHGGCRLENDLLITTEGAEPLTNAGIVYL